jgi:hypothetical protein
MLELSRYSFGVGDRFGLSAVAQLRAIQRAAAEGMTITPVWNKSNREHEIIGSEPADTAEAARHAVETTGWDGPYLVDADHVTLATVDRFVDSSDYFTIDVADSIGADCSREEIDAFLGRHPELLGEHAPEGLSEPMWIERADAERVAGRYLTASVEAGRIYQRIASAKDTDFVTEVSMDETDDPQTPSELLIILAALADAGVPVQAIAPKFTGRFNKGVDYEGDLGAFERELNDDLVVIAHAVEAYELPKTLKLSIHSGSDKFSLYPLVRGALRRHDAGIHVKTAGTTWLEEVIGLAEAGGDAYELVRDICREALGRIDELSAPYGAVIAIDRGRLPSEAEVLRWPAQRFVAALRHRPGEPSFDASLRQLVHVAYKLAAERGSVYLDAVRSNRASVERNVSENLLDRHLRPLFGADRP